MEEWRDIPAYPGYMVSSLGAVFSHKLKRVLISPHDKDGYCRIGLWKDQIRKNHNVHRLVANAFIPNPDNLPVVNHKDGIKTNNNIINLEWCSIAYNNQHAYTVLGKSVKGIHSKPITLIKDSIEYSFKQIREAMKFLKCSGKSWAKLQDGLKDNINGYRIIT